MKNRKGYHKKLIFSSIVFLLIFSLMVLIINLFGYGEFRNFHQALIFFGVGISLSYVLANIWFFDKLDLTFSKKEYVEATICSSAWI